MIDDGRYGINPNPNACVHMNYKGLCAACRLGIRPALSDVEKEELSKLSEWDRLYRKAQIIKEKMKEI